MFAEEPSSETTTLNRWRIGHVVLVEGTVGSVAEDDKVGAECYWFACCTSLVGDVVWASAGLRGRATTLHRWLRSRSCSTTYTHLCHLLCGRLDGHSITDNKVRTNYSQ